MDKKYLMISIDDEKAKAIAGVLGNKTCKKIIDCLAEKEASEKDLADSLKLPINTIEYNLKKLLEAGLIEKAKNFFWSKKGRKIDIYKISNKSIIISPKTSKVSSKFKSLAIVAGLSGIVAIILRKLNQISSGRSSAGVDLTDAFVKSEVAEAMSQSGGINLPLSPISAFSQIPIWLWFLIGCLFALTIITILNLKKHR